jgi:hypothetical protein
MIGKGPAMKDFCPPFEKGKTIPLEKVPLF